MSHFLEQLRTNTECLIHVEGGCSFYFLYEAQFGYPSLLLKDDSTSTFIRSGRLFQNKDLIRFFKIESFTGQPQQRTSLALLHYIDQTIRLPMPKEIYWLVMFILWTLYAELKILPVTSGRDEAKIDHLRCALLCHLQVLCDRRFTKQVPQTELDLDYRFIAACLSSIPHRIQNTPD